MAQQGTFVTVSILKWAEYNPRSDVKKPSWFRVEYRLLEHPDFYDFTHEEFIAWFYVCAQACRLNSDTVRLNYAHAQATRRISRKALDSALKKLTEIQMVRIHVTDANANVTHTSRIRHADDTHTNATGRDGTEQDGTEQETVSPGAAQVTLDFDAFWSKYPRKIKKPDARVRFERLIRDQQDYTLLLQALNRFCAYHQQEQTQVKYIPHCTTFLGTKETQAWREWLDPETGTGVGPPADEPFDIRKILEQKQGQVPSL
jgi:hypothetical protein